MSDSCRSLLRSRLRSTAVPAPDMEEARTAEHCRIERTSGDALYEPDVLMPNDTVRSLSPTCFVTRGNIVGPRAVYRRVRTPCVRWDRAGAQRRTAHCRGAAFHHFDTPEACDMLDSSMTSRVPAAHMRESMNQAELAENDIDEHVN